MMTTEIYKFVNQLSEDDIPPLISLLKKMQKKRLQIDFFKSFFHKSNSKKKAFELFNTKLSSIQTLPLDFDYSQEMDSIRAEKLQRYENIN